MKGEGAGMVGLGGEEVEEEEEGGVGVSRCIVGGLGGEEEVEVAMVVLVVLGGEVEGNVGRGRECRGGAGEEVKGSV